MDTLSFLWVLVAFVSGGSVGVLVMALMCMAGGLPDQAQHVPSLKEHCW